MFLIKEVVFLRSFTGYIIIFAGKYVQNRKTMPPNKYRSGEIDSELEQFSIVLYIQKVSEEAER